MFMDEQKDLKLWMSENAITPELISGDDALDHVVFDAEDSELDEACYDSLPAKYSNGYVMANNLSFSNITMPITFNDMNGKNHLPFDDEKEITRRGDSEFNSFIEVKVPEMKVSLTAIGFEYEENARSYEVGEEVVYTRDLSQEETLSLVNALGYENMREFGHMIANETFLQKSGPISMRDNVYDQLFNPNTYAARVAEREKLIDSIMESIEQHPEIRAKRENIRIENDYATNSNLKDNEIVFGDSRRNFQRIISHDNSQFYKAEVIDGIVKPDTITNVRKLNYGDIDRKVEYEMPHTMDYVLALRAKELGLERKDVYLEGDKAVLKTDGDLSRYNGLYIKGPNEKNFVPISDDTNQYKLGYQSVFANIATETEAMEYNAVHPIEIEISIAEGESKEQLSIDDDIDLYI